MLLSLLLGNVYDYDDDDDDTDDEISDARGIRPTVTWSSEATRRPNIAFQLWIWSNFIQLYRLYFTSATASMM